MISVDLTEFTNSTFNADLIIFYKLSGDEEVDLKIYELILDLLYESRCVKDHIFAKFIKVIVRSQFRFCLFEYPVLKYFQKIPVKGEEYKCLTKKK